MGERLPICTVIGFPNGYDTTAAKCFMATDAVEGGADEVDMVIHLGWVKDRRYDLVEQEIRQIKAACRGRLLKVIVETCLLTDEEKIEMCHVVTQSGADYIKTSIGLFQGRRHLPRCGAVCRPCGAECENQGGRWVPAWKMQKNFSSWRVPPGHLPHCQISQSHGALNGNCSKGAIYDEISDPTHQRQTR